MLPGGLRPEDFDILEFIASRDLITDPKTIVANTDLDHQLVKNRLRRLLEADLVRRPETVPEGISPKGLYEATDLGKAYVDGDMTIAELRDMLENRESE